MIDPAPTKMNNYPNHNWTFDMNAYHFIKNFICPYCNKAPQIKMHKEPLESVGKWYQCPCNNTQRIDYPQSDSLIVFYEDLKVQIAVDAKEVIFQLLDTKENERGFNILCYNYIPNFVKETPKDSIVFLETLVVFQ